MELSMRTTLLSALLVSTLLATPAYAAMTPQPSGADPRVKHVIYHEQDVTVVKGHYGYSTSVEFGQDEKITTMSIGDSVAWQVQPAGDNLLFLKPLQPNANTNLTVVTNKRIYSFELSADVAASRRSRELTYRLRFTYPDEEAEALANIGKGPLAGSRMIGNGGITPDKWNFKYSFSGSSNIRPIKMFDDGKFTYFEFPSTERSPAIFVVDDEGNESLVNFSKQGSYVVVQRLGKRFTLRDGSDVTCIFNDTYPATPAPSKEKGTLAPTVKEKEKEKETTKATAAPVEKVKSTTLLPASYDTGVRPRRTSSR